jgi:hypothetical protein
VWVQATARARWRGRVAVVTNYRHKDATPHMPAACSCSFYTSGRLGDAWETMAVLRGGRALGWCYWGYPIVPISPYHWLGLLAHIPMLRQSAARRLFLFLCVRSLNSQGPRARGGADVFSRSEVFRAFCF